MKILNTKIKDLKIIKSNIYNDNRGFLREIYKKKVVGKTNFPFDIITYSKKNVLRGLHFQTKKSQANVKAWEKATGKKYADQDKITRKGIALKGTDYTPLSEISAKKKLRDKALEIKRTEQAKNLKTRNDKILKIINNNPDLNAGQIAKRAGVNDIVVTRISKYAEQDNGSTQKWGIMKYLRWAGIDNAIAIGRMLIASGTIESGSDVITPFTDEEGESYEFYLKYPEIIDSISDLSRN